MIDTDKKEVNRVKLAQGVAHVMAEMFTPEQMELRKVIAMDRHLMYLEYIAAGFDPEQAIKLCKS